VKNNIERVFTRFVDDGKTTIRFKHPPHDIRIRCDSLQLKLFLRALKLVLGEKVPSKTLILSNITHKFKVPPIPKTKIVILSKAEYPVLNGFPKTVEILKVKYACQLYCTVYSILSLNINLGLFSLFSKNESRLIKSPVCLCALI
jgi:LRR-repeat protein 1